MVQTFQEFLFYNKCYAVELLKNYQGAHLTQRIYRFFCVFLKSKNSRALVIAVL